MSQLAKYVNNDKKDYELDSTTVIELYALTGRQVGLISDKNDSETAYKLIHGSINVPYTKKDEDYTPLEDVKKIPLGLAIEATKVIMELTGIGDVKDTIEQIKGE